MVQAGDQNARLLNQAVETALDSGTATAGGAATLTDAAKSWPVDAFGAIAIVEIVEGVGWGQVRLIVSNTATVLTVATNWTTPPDATSRYAIRKIAERKAVTSPTVVFAALVVNDVALHPQAVPVQPALYTEKTFHIRATIAAGAPAPLNAWVEISPSGAASSWEPLATPTVFVVAGNDYIAFTTQCSFARLVVQQPAWPGGVNSWSVSADFEAG
ncbi:MAG: hypothetical protein V1724_02915 [Chloroflexota bacterium]